MTLRKEFNDPMKKNFLEFPILQVSAPFVNVLISSLPLCLEFRSKYCIDVVHSLVHNQPI